MSLKAFHIVFITASILLALGVSGMSLRQYLAPDGARTDLMWAIGAGLAAVALLVYGSYFLKKLRKISFL
jgi:hypothetical protein